jgi:hypothetical protein
MQTHGKQVANTPQTVSLQNKTPHFYGVFYGNIKKGFTFLGRGESIGGVILPHFL